MILREAINRDEVPDIPSVHHVVQDSPPCSPFYSMLGDCQHSTLSHAHAYSIGMDETRDPSWVDA